MTAQVLFFNVFSKKNMHLNVIENNLALPMSILKHGSHPNTKIHNATTNYAHYFVSVNNKTLISPRQENTKSNNETLLSLNPPCMRPNLEKKVTFGTKYYRKGLVWEYWSKFQCYIEVSTLLLT